MAYCRRSDGDVYMFGTAIKMGMVKVGVIVCCNCDLLGNDYRIFNSRRDAMAHLIDHLAAGHAVPMSAITRLCQEILEQGDII